MPTNGAMIDIVNMAAAKAGGVVALARGLGIKHTALYSWKKVPAERVLDVERLTGVSRHELRPDVFGPKILGPATASSPADGVAPPCGDVDGPPAGSASGGPSFQEPAP